MRKLRVTHRDREIAVAIHGEGDATPLVCVPGGPATSHRYIDVLGSLPGRRVIFYDPLGSGESERPEGTEWTVEDYRDELDTVCRELGLTRYALFAHSVAGFAVYPFAFARPEGLTALVLASAPPSIPVYQAAARRLLALSPVELAAFERADRGETAKDVDYMRTYQRFLLEHLCRVRPTPQRVWQGIQDRNLAAYQRLKGGAIFYTSALRDWDVSARLAEIAVPALVTCGRHDLLSPEVCADLARRIPRAELSVFEESSHMPHLEETERYLHEVARFLDQVVG